MRDPDFIGMSEINIYSGACKKKRRRKYMKFQIVNERIILEISGFLD